MTLVLQFPLTTFVSLTIVVDFISLFTFLPKCFHLIHSSALQCERLPNSHAMVQNVNNFFNTLFKFISLCSDTKRFLITLTPLIYFLPCDSLCSIPKLTYFFHIPNSPISSITFYQSHVTVSIHSINYTSLTWQKFSNLDSKKIV